jgi:hypothetical protein
MSPEAALQLTRGELHHLRDHSVATEILYKQLTPHADPSCTYCDGRGVFYGNVAICGCVLAKLERAA